MAERLLELARGARDAIRMFNRALCDVIAGPVIRVVCFILLGMGLCVARCGIRTEREKRNRPEEHIGGSEP